MKKTIILIILCTVFVVTSIFAVRIRKNNIEEVLNSCRTAIESESINFNESHSIKYDNLSDNAKRYITKNEFDTMKSWFDAEKVFNKIPKSEKYSYNEYIIENFNYNNERYIVYCSFGYTDVSMDIKLIL